MAVALWLTKSKTDLPPLRSDEPERESGRTLSLMEREMKKPKGTSLPEVRGGGQHPRAKGGVWC